MAKAPLRTPIQGPAFIRLIARLTSVPFPESSPSLADRLSEWVDWTRALALSTALDGRLPASRADFPESGSGEEEDLECARVRAALLKAIDADVEPMAAKLRQRESRMESAAETPTHPEYTAFRERYRDLQQTMQTATGRLRGRLRDVLVTGSPELARLAEIDAVMEMTLSPREHALLGAVPDLLEQHFDRLQELGGGSEVAPDIPAGSDASTAAPWLRQFQQDMRSVLLAELDVRFHPIEGLLAALRAR